VPGEAVGSGGFNPGFGETEEVRFMAINQGRVERMKYGADVESTDGELYGFNSMSPERREKTRSSGLRKPRVCWRVNSRKTAGWVRMRWDCC